MKKPYEYNNNSKPKLHKRHKQWILISTTMLSLLSTTIATNKITTTQASQTKHYQQNTYHINQILGQINQPIKIKVDQKVMTIKPHLRKYKFTQIKRSGNNLTGLIRINHKVTKFTTINLNVNQLYLNQTDITHTNPTAQNFTVKTNHTLKLYNPKTGQTLNVKGNTTLNVAKIIYQNNLPILKLTNGLYAPANYYDIQIITAPTTQTNGTTSNHSDTTKSSSTSNVAINTTLNASPIVWPTINQQPNSKNNETTTVNYTAESTAASKAASESASASASTANSIAASKAASELAIASTSTANSIAASKAASDAASASASTDNSIVASKADSESASASASTANSIAASKAASESASASASTANSIAASKAASDAASASASTAESIATSKADSDAASASASTANSIAASKAASEAASASASTAESIADSKAASESASASASTANSIATSKADSESASASASTANSIAASKSASDAASASASTAKSIADSKANTFSNQLTLTAASTDKARYNPGSTVNLSYTMQNTNVNEQSKNPVTITIYKDNQAIDSSNATPIVAANDTKSFNYQWTTPNTDYQGYRAEISVDNQVVKTVAIDVSSDINKFPRYGALTEFSPGTNNADVLNLMKNLNINSLEYYDAYHTPQQPIPSDNPTGNYDQPWAVWLSKEAQTKSGQVVKDTVDQAHALGMDSMFYNMIYAITGNANDPNYLKSIGVNPTWLLYHADGNDKGQLFQFPMAGYINDHNDPNYQAALQTYLDITNPDVVNWIVDKMGPVLKDLDFDGWHGDTIGNNDLMEVKDANGNVTKTYHVDDELATFANMVKQRLADKKFVINTVSFGGEPSVATSKTDFDYSEQWDGTYYSLDQKIKYINYLSGKSLVIPGYLQSTYASNHKGADFNENAVLLMDAIVYGAGGSRMESVDGNHLLVGAFFPSKDLNVSSDLQTKFQNYQTFITAYENLLRDGQSDNYNTIDLFDNQGQTIARSSNATPNTVYVYSRSSSSEGDTIQLINMLGVTSDKWQDDDGSRQDPTTVNNFNVHYYPKDQYAYDQSQQAQHVYLASPDGDQPNTSIEVPFTWQTDANGNHYMNIQVPFLQRWDMLYLK